MSTDPTTLPPDVPKLEPGRWTEELDKWIEDLVRASVRTEAQGLPDWLPPEEETSSARRARYLPWMHTITRILWAGSVVGLLIRVAQLAPEHADAIANELDEWLDSGDFYPEWAWDWARQRGLDPDAIADKQREYLKADAAEDAIEKERTRRAAEEALRPLQRTLFEAQEALAGWQPAAYPTHESATTAWDLASDAVIDAQDAVIAKAFELLGVQQ